MNTHDTVDDQTLLRLAEAVRAACVQAALEGFEQAAMDGLCCEGALECGVSAMRSLKVDALVREIAKKAGIA